MIGGEEDKKSSFLINDRSAKNPLKLSFPIPYVFVRFVWLKKGSALEPVIGIAFTKSRVLKFVRFTKPGLSPVKYP